VTDVDVLQTLLATENAAAYGYGVLGGHLASDERTVASQAEDAHLARRDAVARLVRDRGVSPTPAAPGYVVPGPVADRTAALTLAARLEDGAAAAYRYGLAATPNAGIRRLAVAALQDAAVRAVRWRLLLAPTAPATRPFPGEAFPGEPPSASPTPASASLTSAPTPPRS